MQTKKAHFIKYIVTITLMIAIMLVVVACGTSSAGTQTPIVTPTLSSITVNPSAPSNLWVGSTQQFNAVGNYSDGSSTDISSQVQWASSDATIATISSSGLATGVAAGSCTIMASLSGVTSANVNLTVVPAPTLVLISINPGYGTIAVGATKQFAAQGTFSDGSDSDITSTVTWISSDSTIATISNSGLATGVGPGVCDITASASGVPSSSMVILTVTAQ